MFKIIFFMLVSAVAGYVYGVHKTSETAAQVITDEYDCYARTP